MRGPVVGALLVVLRAASAGAQEVPPVQDHLLDADLRVEQDRAGIRAELHYRLRPAPGTREIPVEVLPFADAVPAAPTAFVWEDPVPLRLEPSPSGLLEGVIRLPAAVREGDVVNLRFRYRVRSGAGAGPDAEPSGRLVRVPLVVVPWPPAEAAPGTFTGRIVLPAGGRFEAAFPTTWVEEAASAGEARYRTDLPVLPSFVSFTVSPGGAERASVLPAGALLLAGGFGLLLLALRAARRRRRAPRP